MESIVRSYTLRIEPATHVENRTDYFGNPIACFSIPERHQAMSLEAISEVQILPRTLPDPGQTLPWERVREGLRQRAFPDWLEATQFLFDSKLVMRGADLAAFARGSFSPGRPILEAALDLNRRIHEQIAYVPRSTDVETTAIQALELQRGVCQDLAHIFAGAVRSIGLPARYVSGYLRTRPAPGQPIRVGADESHAWVSVYLGDAGWVDLDPTNDLVVREEHVLLGWGRDYRDVAPLLGIYLGGKNQTLHVEVDVTPVETSDESLLAESHAPGF
jgi:transglutaminase-like putative cysteine protease